MNFDSIAARLSGGASVPSIGGAKPVSLEAALARVAAAENELENARSEARRLARAKGKGLSGLFAKGAFISRNSATRWVDEARAEAFDEGYAKACTHYEQAFNPSGPSLYARALHRRPQAGFGFGDAPVTAVDPIEARQREILRSRETDFSNQMAGAPTEPAALSAAILAAGQRARQATDKDPERPMNALSKAIVEAGRARRKMSGEEK